MTDPISDMLTRIRNAMVRRREAVEVPFSGIKLRILEVLREEGFIQGCRTVEVSPFKVLQVILKYDAQEESVISGLKRISTPGRRVYVRRDQIPWVNRGVGIAIMSTTQGIMTDRKSRQKKVGGEVLCSVW